MEKKEIIIGDVLVAMDPYLNAEQLRKLENVLRMKLQGFAIEEECTELSTDVDDNDYILKLFAANKKLEGCKSGTIEQYLRQTKDLLTKCDKNYKNITKDDIKCYLAIYGQGVKPNTLSNAKRFLSAFFSWANDEGYITANPVRQIKGIKQVDVPNKHLSMEEEVAVRDVPKSKRDTAIIDVLLSTGLRVGEIAAMNRNNVNLLTGSVTFIGEKNGRERTVYLDVRAKKHLLEYLQTRNDNNEALFVTNRMYRDEYGIIGAKRMSKHAFECITKGLCEKAGIVDKVCTVHVFRKTFATRLADNGCPLEIIQELLGHSSAAVTSKHYVAKTQTRVKREFERCMVA